MLSEVRGCVCNVFLDFTVYHAGNPEDIWIMQSAGYVLDGSAATTVSKYLSSPGLCHDMPVPAPVYVDVTFSIF